MVSTKKYSSHFLLFLSSLSLLLVEIRSTPISAAETEQSQDVPEGRQGILEIPKQAATIIRNFIDRNIQSYLNLTTPAPLNNVPPELKDSIVGNFLLGNLYATIPPAPTFTPQRVSQETEVKPIIITNENTFLGHTKFVEPSTVPTTTPVAIQSSPQVSTNKTRVNPNASTNKVHTLDADTSLSGIYNSYGLLVNNNPDHEVYWIPEATRPSVVIPIATSTSPKPDTTPEQEAESVTDDGAVEISPEPERVTEESPVETTTEEDEEEGIEEEAIVK